MWDISKAVTKTTSYELGKSITYKKDNSYLNFGLFLLDLFP
jgi:hypothetical protein